MSDNLNLSDIESELEKSFNFSCSDSSQFDDTDDDPDYTPSLNHSQRRVHQLLFNSSQANESDESLIDDPPERETNEENYVANVENAPGALHRTPYSNLVWTDPVGNHKDFQFTDNHGMDPTIAGVLAMADPIDYFSLMLTEDIIQKMVDETNLYATECLITTDALPHSRIHFWTPTDVNEMKKFLILIGWMGVVVLPRIADYWSTHIAFSLPFPKLLMSRNRFLLLLKFWHFNDNAKYNPQEDNRLYKIEPIVRMFIRNYQKEYTLGSKVCIDETMVPHRGRLSFKQYIPTKASKYGVKLYKLCAGKGYTYNLEIYCGKDSAMMEPGSESAIESVVLRLMKDLMNKGRTLYTDNFYTSIPLTYKLLEQQTHLVGTLRGNRKYLPQEVRDKKFNRGEMISKETKDGVSVIKFHDKKDVYMLTTCHKSDVTKTIRVRNKEVERPLCKLDYDIGKCAVDVSDQLASYNSALRKSTRWYRKVVIELIWGTSLVNAYHLYSLNTTSDTIPSITDFRLSIIQSMTKQVTEEENNPRSSSTNKRRRTHHHISHPTKKRVRCVGCYSKYGRNGKIINGKKVIASYVYKICDECNVHLCNDCFNEEH